MQLQSVQLAVPLAMIVVLLGGCFWYVSLGGSKAKRERRKEQAQTAATKAAVGWAGGASIQEIIADYQVR